jgi:hypothetical protein
MNFVCYCKYIPIPMNNVHFSEIFENLIAPFQFAKLTQLIKMRFQFAKLTQLIKMRFKNISIGKL